MSFRFASQVRELPLISSLFKTDRPEGADLRVTYIFKIRLQGRLPNSIVSYATTETPLCVGKARDAFYEREHSLVLTRDPFALFVLTKPLPIPPLQTVSPLTSRTRREKAQSSSRTSRSTQLRRNTAACSRLERRAMNDSRSCMIKNGCTSRGLS